MAGNYWIKFYIEILDDPKMATLPDRLWRRFYELCLIAGRSNKNGDIPGIKQTAWILRMDPAELAKDMEELLELGLITDTGDDGTGWNITNFSKRQSKLEPAEKMQRYRDERKREHYYNDGVTGPVTLSNNSVTQITETDTDKRREETDTGSAPQFFNTGWHDQVFIQTTGISGIPRGDAPKVYEALDALRSKFTTEADMVAYLKPYFEAWTSKKTKDGRHFSKSNCAWLYDWALAGDTINAPKLDRVLEVFHAPEHDPDCPLCHGKGKYMSEKSGRMVACDCVKVYEEVQA